MLLHAITPEMEGVEICYFESSNIPKSIYNYHENTLSIYFSSGTTYKYSDISNGEYIGFKLAESQGVFFNKSFRKKEFTKDGTFSISLITEEVNGIKKNEEESFFELAKIKMQGVIDHVHYNEVLINDLIKTLSKLVDMKKAG